MKKHALSELIFDFDLYPRGQVDSHHVTEIVAAIDAGATMPPPIICAKTKRIVDGFHRIRAYLRRYDEDYEVECIEKTYANDKDLFLDAMRYNAAHGRALTQHDKAHCLILAKKFRIKQDLVAAALNITTERIGSLTTTRIGRAQGSPIALKRTISHMAGHDLTPDQAAANKKLSGMNQMFYVNQLITLIESDLLTTDDDDLMAGLAKLSGLLSGLLKKKAA